MMKHFLAENPGMSGPWNQALESRFREWRATPGRNSNFAYEPTSMKRMIAVAMALRIKGGIPVSGELLRDVSIEECLAWRDVPTAPSSKLLPAFRKIVKSTYGVRLAGANSEWTWTVPVGVAECRTVITFGGHFCQFSYERQVTFPDSAERCPAMSWEETLGELPAKWDLMTGETMAADLELFFTFGREMEDRIRKFSSSPV